MASKLNKSSLIFGVRLSTSGSAWSSPSSRNEPRMLAARVSSSSFQDLVELCLINGVSNVESTMDKIKSEIPQKRYELQRDMLNNIKHALIGKQIFSLPVEKLENTKVISPEGSFVTKCLALADRIKTRDIFDLWWFIKNENHNISEIFTVIQEAMPHITYENIRYRLLDWDIPLTDEGLESVAPIPFEKVRGELRDMVDSLEVEMAKRIAKSFKP